MTLSKLSFTLSSNIHTTRFNTHITLELKPAQAEGLILYMAGAQYTGDYLSLLLVNGSLIFTYSLGSGDRSHNLHSL